MLYGFMLIAEDGQCWETKIGQGSFLLFVIKVFKSKFRDVEVDNNWFDRNGDCHFNNWFHSCYHCSPMQLGLVLYWFRYFCYYSFAWIFYKRPVGWDTENLKSPKTFWHCATIRQLFGSELFFVHYYQETILLIWY